MSDYGTQATILRYIKEGTKDGVPVMKSKLLGSLRHIPLSELNATLDSMVRRGEIIKHGTGTTPKGGRPGIAYALGNSGVGLPQEDVDKRIEGKVALLIKGRGCVSWSDILRSVSSFAKGEQAAAVVEDMVRRGIVERGSSKAKHGRPATEYRRPGYAGDRIKARHNAAQPVRPNGFDLLQHISTIQHNGETYVRLADLAEFIRMGRLLDDTINGDIPEAVDQEVRYDDRPT